MEDLGVLTGGEDHLGLEAGLEEEAVSRHGAASATMRGTRADISITGRQRHRRFPPGGTCC